MIDENSDTEERWPSVAGSILVVAVLFSLGLIAAGGWSCFQKFLENSAAAWVQAIGSVAAILAAIYMSRAQFASHNTVERLRLAEEDHKKFLVIGALQGSCRLNHAALG